MNNIDDTLRYITTYFFVIVGIIVGFVDICLYFKNITYKNEKELHDKLRTQKNVIFFLGFLLIGASYIEYLKIKENERLLITEKEKNTRLNALSEILELEKDSLQQRSEECIKAIEESKEKIQSAINNNNLLNEQIAVDARTCYNGLVELNKIAKSSIASTKRAEMQINELGNPDCTEIKLAKKIVQTSMKNAVRTKQFLDVTATGFKGMMENLKEQKKDIQNTLNDITEMLEKEKIAN